MGRLDHVHVRVPDRAAAAEWNASRLGFETVAEYDFWATDANGGRPDGEPLTVDDVVDFDLCWAFDLADRGEP